VWVRKIRANPKAIPAITEELLVIGSAQDHILFAIDRHTSEDRWIFKTEGGIESSPKIYLNSVYIGSNDKNLYSLNLQSGEMLFHFSTGNSIKTSPVISDQTVFFGSWDRYIYAISAESGKLIWRYQTGDWIQVNPVLENNTLFVTSMDKKIYALNIKTGELIWSYKCIDRVESEPQISGNFLILSNQRNKIIGLDLKTGEKKWEYTTGFEITLNPTAIEDIIIYADSGKTIVAINSATGEKIWENKTNSVLSGFAGKFSEDYFFCAGEDKNLYLLKKETGEVSTTDNLPIKTISRPTKIFDDLMVVGDDGSVYYLENFFTPQITKDEKFSSAPQKISTPTGIAIQEKMRDTKPDLSKPSLIETPISQIQPSVKIETQMKPLISEQIKSGSTERVVEKLKTAVKNLGSNLVEKEYGYSVHLTGRHNIDKEVFIFTNGKDFDGEPYILMITPLYPVSPQRLISALRQNPLLSYGSISIARMGTTDIIILRETQFGDSADIPELEAMLKSLAKRERDFQQTSLMRRRLHFLYDSQPDILSGQRLLEETQKLMRFDFKKAEKGFEIYIEKNEGQIKISMLMDKVDSSGNNMITFVALCGNFKETIEESLKLLKSNLKIPYGGFGIIKSLKQYLVVLTDTRILSHTQPVEIRKSLLSIASGVEAFQTRKF